jgi:hypothetical protein
LTIVTHNRRHFEHIEGLQIEDWAVCRSSFHSNACRNIACFKVSHS